MKFLKTFENFNIFKNEKDLIKNNCICLINDEKKICIIDKSHIILDFVDLGLPSGKKWASCNLGASKPEEYGDYYFWGGLEPCNDELCVWSATPFNNGSSVFDEEYFNTNSGTWLTYDAETEKNPNYDFIYPYRLKYEYDIAYKLSGGKGCIPTGPNYDELYQNTDKEWVTINNISGIKYTSKHNGNSVFFPAAGARNGDKNYYQDINVLSWMSQFGNMEPGTAFVNFQRAEMMGNQAVNIDRFAGCVIRPVSV